jgi:predicted enzyme related to lactoylglutathione lyase
MPRHTRTLKDALLIMMLAAAPAAAQPGLAVGPQYDTTHVYVSPGDFDRFVASLLATFGGTATKQGVFTVTPTPSRTKSQLVLTQAGTVSAFGFVTPVPYPFGAERTGYLVTDMDAALREARNAGASILVAQFPDPIGRDAVVQWPGGVNMQLYWHTTAPHYPALKTVPDNRVYLPEDSAAAFVRDFTAFSHGRVIADERNAPGEEIGRPGQPIHRIELESGFGRILVFATDGHVPYPYGREMTGYAVADLATTLVKAKSAGATVLVAPFAAAGRQTAMVMFPGGYIAEIHSKPQK